MNLSDLQNDPFFIKFIQKTARMLGEWYQEKAPSMTNDELYADSEFFPLYNPERDYSMKPDGYVCKNEDGVMMRLVRQDDGPIKASSSITRDLVVDKSNSVIWKTCWSTNPDYAREFVSSELSPYNTGEVCWFDGFVYKSLVDGNTKSPSESSNDWEQIAL